MVKTAIASLIVLLGSTAVSAGTLAWAPVGPYPVNGGCQPISFDQPDAIAVDKAGDIYIANETGPNAVQEISVTAGTIRTLLSRSSEAIGSGYYSGISLALGPEGNLFLAVKQRGTVERLNGNGTLTLIAGRPGDRELVDGSASRGRLNAPNAIAIGSDGTIYVTDTRTIRKIGRHGAITTLAGSPHAKISDAQGHPYFANGKARRAVFMSPNGLAVGTHGQIYMADSYVGDEEGQGVDIGLVRQVAHGAVTTIAGTIDTTGWSDTDGVGEDAVFGGIHGIAIASSGVVYVTEASNGIGSIRRIGSDAAVTTVVKSPHTGDVRTTGLINPAGIAVSSNGILYVTEDFEDPDFAGWRVDWLHRILGNKLETLCRGDNLQK